MKIEVSDGEVVDKYSIICLKLEKIQDVEKRKHLLREKEILEEVATPLVQTYPLYYQLLQHVNQVIWEKTDEIKELDPSCKDYALVANTIFEYNDKRFRLKRIFQFQSSVQEQKSYAQKTLTIHIQDPSFLIQHLVHLTYCLLEYDGLLLQGDVEPSNVVFCFFPPCCVSITNTMTTSMEYKTINQEEVKDRCAWDIISSYYKSHGPEC